MFTVLLWCTDSREVGMAGAAPKLSRSARRTMVPLQLPRLRAHAESHSGAGVGGGQGGRIPISLVEIAECLMMYSIDTKQEWQEQPLGVHTS